MQEQFIEIKTAEGVMEAFVPHTEENGPFPAVIIYMDIWGVREELYDIARRVGTVGSTAWSPTSTTAMAKGYISSLETKTIRPFRLIGWQVRRSLKYKRGRNSATKWSWTTPMPS